MNDLIAYKGFEVTNRHPGHRRALANWKLDTGDVLVGERIVYAESFSHRRATYPLLARAGLLASGLLRSALTW